MIPNLEVVVDIVVRVIAACVFPFYYCKKPIENSDGNNSIESATPIIRIKISHRHRKQLSNTSCDIYDNRQYAIDSKDINVVQEVKPVSSEKAQIVPLSSSSKSRRRVSRIWSASLRKQLESIADSSPEITAAATKVVRAQIETNRAVSSASNQEPSEMLEEKSFSVDCNSPGLIFDQSYINNDNRGKILTATGKKWKNFKKKLIRSRTNRSKLPVPHFTQPSPKKNSTKFHRKFVDVSTSTRIGASVPEKKRRQSEEMSRNRKDWKKTDESPSKESQGASSPSKETLKEIVSLANRRFVNGKTVCDVKIRGLVVSQSELLSLLELSTDQIRSASFVTSEESSTINIRLQHPGNKNDGSNDAGKLEGEPLFKLLKSKHAIPSIQISNRSNVTNGSKNDTSYIPYNVVRNRVAENSVLRDRSISKRFSNYRA